jgi:uncharacterized protein
MKKRQVRLPITISWILVSFIFLSVLIGASEFPTWNNEYVNDYANIFSEQERALLVGLLQEVRENTTAEVVIVTLNNFSGQAPSDYATKLFNEWKIGKADKDNGLLIVYGVQENKIWVTTGYGLEGILPDSKIGRYLDDYYVPLRDSGNVSQGIVEFTKQMSIILKENAEEIKSGQAGSNDSGFMFVIIAIIFIFLIIFIIRMNKSQEKFTKDVKSKPEKKPKNKKVAFLVGFGNFASVVLFLIYIVTGVFLFFLGGIVLAIFLRFLLPRELRAASGFWFLPGPSSSGSGLGGGGFSGGGFGGGFSGGGGAGR